MKHLIIKKFFLSLILPIFLVSNFGLVTTQASTATQSSQAKKTTKAKTTAKKKAKSKAVASKNSKRNASKSQKKVLSLMVSKFLNTYIVDATITIVYHSRKTQYEILSNIFFIKSNLCA